MHLIDLALAAALILTLTIMGTLGWRAAQQGALPTIPQHWEAR